MPAKIDIQKILADARENMAKLASCKRHKFERNDSTLKAFFVKFKCANCGGVVESREAQWYEKGLEHGINIITNPQL